MLNDRDFYMKVEDVFFIRRRGTVVTGVISRGTLRVGDVVTLNTDEDVKQVRVAGIEIFRRRTNSAGAGERVAIVLPDIAKDEVSRGDVLESSISNSDGIWWEVENDN
jgi:elongation factor Tu